LFFADLDGTEIELTFDEIEELIGSGLPTSARRHAAWWSNAQHHAVWSEHGWRASPKLGSGLVRFRRVERNASTARAPSRGSSRRPPDGAPRLLLLGCVKGKRSAASPAKDLYVSALWEKRRQYAESSGQPWRILSAEPGPPTSNTSGARRSSSRQAGPPPRRCARRSSMQASSFIGPSKACERENISPGMWRPTLAPCPNRHPWSRSRLRLSRGRRSS